MSENAEHTITINVKWGDTPQGTVPLSIVATDPDGQKIEADLLAAPEGERAVYAYASTLHGDAGPVRSEKLFSYFEVWQAIGEHLGVQADLVTPNEQRAAFGVEPLSANDVLQASLTSENIKAIEDAFSYGSRGESIQKIELTEPNLTFGGRLTPCEQLQRGDKALVILDLEYLRQDTDGYVFTGQPDGRLVTIQPHTLMAARIMRNPRIDAAPITIGETVQWQVSTGRVLMSHPPKEQFDLVEGKVIAIYHQRKTLTVAKDGDNLELKCFGEVSRPSGVPIDWEADRYKDGLSAAITLNVDGHVTGMKTGTIEIISEKGNIKTGTMEIISEKGNLKIRKAGTPLKAGERVWWMEPGYKVMLPTYPPKSARQGVVKAVMTEARVVVVNPDHAIDLVLVKVVDGDFGRTDLTAPPISWDSADAG